MLPASVPKPNSIIGVEKLYTSLNVPSLAMTAITTVPLILRSDNTYADEDCTTSTSSSETTTSSSTGAAGAVINPSCTVTKLSDAVIGLGVLCGFSIIGCVTLLFLFIRQSKLSRGRSRSRNRDSSPSRSHPGSPLPPWLHDHFRDFDPRSRRRRVYDGLSFDGSRDGRLHRRHSMHGSPRAQDPLARGPLSPPPRYVERAPGNMPRAHNAGLFPRSSGRRGMFRRSPLAAGYPFLRNPNINPMAFPQAQAGLGNMQMPQMPHHGHIHHQQPPVYQQQAHQHPEQAGMMQPQHQHHAPVAMADMRAAQDQAQREGVRQEEGNIGRSRDPSAAGTAVRDGAFGRLRGEVLGSRRASRSETEGSRSRRGGLYDGGPPGHL